MLSPTFVALASLFIVPSLVKASCNPGYFKLLGVCTACPAGTYDSAGGTGTLTFANNPCQPCGAGTANPNTGQSSQASCVACSDGYFTSDTGSKTCCQCCTGYYSSSDHTSCAKCSGTTLYSPPGSPGSSSCATGTTAQQNAVPTSCAIDPGAFLTPDRCPAVVKGGPEGSAVKKRRDVYKCTPGYKSCPLNYGQGGFECVDTRNDPEMCGGCVGADGEGDGQDCTAIFGISVTTCVKSRCVIESCRKGFRKSEDGKSCLGGTSGLHVQQSRQSRVKRSRF